VSQPLAEIAAAASGSAIPRAQRAARAAVLIRESGSYRWVGIYDVDESDDAVMLGESGIGPSGERVSVPILGAESGTLMGTLDVETATELDVRDDIFGIEPNEAVMHQAVVRQLANKRQGTADTKTRAEVAGGTHKLYKQKGTGQARHGARSAPLFEGGAKAMGPVTPILMLSICRRRFERSD